MARPFTGRSRVLHVVLVAPYFGASMAHCLRCFAALDGVRLGVISQEPEERLPADVRSRVVGHYRVDNALDATQLVAAGRSFQKAWGRVDRLEGYLEQLQVPLGDARDALGVDGLNGGAARNFRDKNRMKQVLAAAGLPVARQARVTSGADARSFVAAVGFPIVMKPLAGAGARDTLRVSTDGELSAALNLLLPSPANPVQAEEFVRGEEHTFETATIGGRPVWSSSSFYLPGPLDVLENPWMQYCVLMPREASMPHVDAFRGVNRAALAALGQRDGFSHMEWFLRSDGQPVVSEVGARPPGANIMKMNGAAHGVDMWARWAQLVVHRTWAPMERTHAAGCAFVRGMGHGRVVTAVRGLDAVRERIGPLVVEAQLPKPGQPRSTHYEGDGWVVVKHPETARVVDALRVLVSELRVEVG
jgi:hypothetical protein